MTSQKDNELRGVGYSVNPADKRIIKLTQGEHYLGHAVVPSVYDRDLGEHVIPEVISASIDRNGVQLLLQNGELKEHTTALVIDKGPFVRALERHILEGTLKLLPLESFPRREQTIDEVLEDVLIDSIKNDQRETELPDYIH
jgi:hypothetical protein